MKLFSNDGSFAVVATGEAPIGIFAIGQISHGFIAIGQVAVGVVALGQAVACVVGIGQVGIGVTWFGAMMGAGGRGFCLRLIPGLDLARTSPETTSLEAIRGGVPDGYVRMQIVDSPRGPRLGGDGSLAPLKLTPAVVSGLRNARGKIRDVFAHVENVNGTLVCDRLVEVPGQRASMPLVVNVLRVVGLVGIATFWWYAFLAP